MTRSVAAMTALGLIQFVSITPPTVSFVPLLQLGFKCRGPGPSGRVGRLGARSAITRLVQTPQTK